MASRDHLCYSVPPSDFKDLVDCILKLNVASAHTFRQLASLLHRLNDITSGPHEQREIATQIVSSASGLETQYQELDAHYGWVLASDHALVHNVLRSYFGDNEGAERWLRTVDVEMAGRRSALCEILQRFEK
jgi:hypothetical protein